MKKRIIGLTLALVDNFAGALDIEPYTPEKLANLQAQNKPAALHFHASWCSTCAAQDAVFKSIESSKDLKGLTLLVVDFDDNKALRSQLKVKSQSTIIVYKGKNEVARSAGDAGADSIKTLLSKGL